MARAHLLARFTPLFLAVLGRALPAQGAEADLALRFADERLQDRDYSRSINEYQRIRKEFPAYKPADVRFRLGLAFAAAGNPEQALDSWRSLATPQAQRAIGELLLAQHHPLEAAHHYELLGWRLPRALALAQAGEDGVAAELLEKDLPTGSRLLRLPLAKRNSLLAGGLSMVLPGSGQLYVGRKGDALSAFFLAGSFDGAGLYYLSRGNLAWGIGTLTVGGLFHAGAAYGAAMEAVRFNRKMHEARIEQLKALVP